MSKADMTMAVASKRFDFHKAPIDECLQELGRMRRDCETTAVIIENRIADARAGKKVECLMHLLTRAKKLKRPVDGCREMFDPSTAVMKIDRMEPTTHLPITYYWCSEACYRSMNIQAQEKGQDTDMFLAFASHRGQSTGQ